MSDQEDIIKQFDPLQQDDGIKEDTPQGGEGIGKKNASALKSYEEKEDDEDEEPFYDFHLFAKQLQDPLAEPIVKYTKSFLRNFQTQRALWTADEQTKLINDFKLFIYDKFLEYEPFKSLDGIKLRNAQEGLEKLVMGKLYNRCFSPCLKSFKEDLDEGHKQDLVDDKKLRAKVAEYKFIKPQDLDIPSSLSERLSKFVKLSGEELNKVNNFKAPRDKMICVLNSCKVIFGILRHHKLEEKGADSFIPLLIYTLLKGEIVALASNVRYIERFRYEDFIRGEASYYLNSLQAAMNFIITLDTETLSPADDDTFQERYEKNQSSIRKTNEIAHVAVADGKATKVQSPLPSEYILHPLDEAANALMHKFNEYFSPPRQGEEQALNPSSAHPSGTNSILPTPTHALVNNQDDHQDISKLAKQIEEQEHRKTLETLQSMFPEMDGDVIEDVCIAKRFRVGASVDVLLSL